MIDTRRNIFVGIFYFLFCVVFMKSSLYSQNDKKINELYKEAAIARYSYPDKLINIGKELLRISGNNIDCKINGYKVIGTGYFQKRRFAKSLFYLTKANENLYLSTDELLKIDVLNKMGAQHHQMKTYDAALEYLEKASDLIAKYPNKDSVHLLLGKNLIYRGLIYKEKLDCSLAIILFKKGIAHINIEKPKMTNSSISYVRCNSAISIAKYHIGNCYTDMANYEFALQSYAESIESAKKIKAKILECYALKGISHIYFLMGKHDLALKSLNKAVSISSNSGDLKLYKELYKELFPNYLAINDLVGYNMFQSKYYEFDEIIKKKQVKSIGDSVDLSREKFKIKLEEEVFKFYIYYAVLTIGLILSIVLFYIKLRARIKRIEADKNRISKLLNQ